MSGESDGRRLQYARAHVGVSGAGAPGHDAGELVRHDDPYVRAATLGQRPSCRRREVRAGDHRHPP
ncbi:MAG: hypothetical protein U0893_10520 [Chloroflexota bacterium]